MMSTSPKSNMATFKDKTQIEVLNEAVGYLEHLWDVAVDSTLDELRLSENYVKRLMKWWHEWTRNFDSNPSHPRLAADHRIWRSERDFAMRSVLSLSRGSESTLKRTGVLVTGAVNALLQEAKILSTSEVDGGDLVGSALSLQADVRQYEEPLEALK